MFGRPIASSRGDSVRNGPMAKLQEEYFNSRFKFQSTFKFHVFLHLFRFHQIIRSHHLNPTQSYTLQCPVKVKLIFTLSNRICFICVQQLLPEQGQKEGQNQCKSRLISIQLLFYKSSRELTHFDKKKYRSNFLKCKYVLSCTQKNMKWVTVKNEPPI